MNKARNASSSRTGLVLKISVAVFIFLGLLVYKINDYFVNEKTYAIQSQIRKGVLSVKTSVSGQLVQLKNALSGYESELDEANINWVQLDPFFVIAKIENQGDKPTVVKIVGRSNTPAERWNNAYLEKALTINRSQEGASILVQLFRDRANAKFILIRFKRADGKELVLGTQADYFQKYFDLERGSRSQTLLITTENIVAGHTEADYIASPSKEANLPPASYLTEKEEIVGTNLVAVSYILKAKIASGFAIPWQISMLILGCALILIGLLVYYLGAIEKRIDRYRQQERQQIYKDTVRQASADLAESSGEADLSLQEQDTVKKAVALDNPLAEKPVLARADEDDFVIEKPAPVENDSADEGELPIGPLASGADLTAESAKSDEPEIINLLERAVPRPVERAKKVEEKVKPELPMRPPEPVAEPELINLKDDVLTLDEEKIDLDEIERALALDDLDSEVAPLNPRAEALEQNLRSQKISTSPVGAPIDKPQFAFEKKDFKVDEIKVNIRRPERS